MRPLDTDEVRSHSDHFFGVQDFISRHARSPLRRGSRSSPHHRDVSVARLAPARLRVVRSSAPTRPRDRARRGWRRTQRIHDVRGGWHDKRGSASPGSLRSRRSEPDSRLERERNLCRSSSPFSSAAAAATPRATFAVGVPPVRSPDATAAAATTSTVPEFLEGPAGPERRTIVAIVPTAEQRSPTTKVNATSRRSIRWTRRRILRKTNCALFLSCPSLSRFRILLFSRGLHHAFCVTTSRLLGKRIQEKRSIEFTTTNANHRPCLRTRPALSLSLPSDLLIPSSFCPHSSLSLIFESISRPRHRAVHKSPQS